MALDVTRREFLTSAAGAAVVAGFPIRGVGQQPPAPSFRTTLHRALIQQKPTAESLAELKAAGFEGLEAGILPVADAERVRASADKLGLRIHSVIRGWAAFNSPKQEEVEQSFQVTVDALNAAHAYGADAVLTVPCRIAARTPGGFGQKDGMLMPRPWEFQVEFDPRTGHLTRAVVGDNRPYADYIQAQNHAIDTSRVMVERLIPVAEKLRVQVALENVWNHLWVTPAHFRHFVASFQSPWIRAYFDIGNHVKYSPPEQWILTLNELLVKVHVKDFLLNPSDSDGQGQFVNIRDGSVRWPIVRAALDAVNYNGWLTIEGGTKITMEEHKRRIDLIINGL